MPKISQLPPVGGVNTVDTLPLVQAGTTARATFSQLPISDAVQTALNTKANSASIGTIASQNANNVTITGGSITGITDLAIADGGTGASTAVNAFTNLKQDATDTSTGVVELATPAEVQTGTDTTRAVTSAGFRSANIVMATPVASTSGTSIDFTGIPSWAKRVNILFSGVSTNSSDPVLIQLGTSGGVETTGYLGSGSSTPSGSFAAVVNNTAGFLINATSPSALLYGKITVELINSATNTWVSSGTFGNSFAAIIYNVAGNKSTAATLDRVRITTTTGTPTFDAGTINISWE
jgi:hypothetical protein